MQFLRNVSVGLIFLFLISGVHPTSVSADVLILTDGSQIKGEIVLEDEQKVEIFKNGIVLTFYAEDIDEVRREELPSSEDLLRQMDEEVSVDKVLLSSGEVIVGRIIGPRSGVTMYNDDGTPRADTGHLVIEVDGERREYSWAEVESTLEFSAPVERELSPDQVAQAAAAGGDNCQDLAARLSRCTPYTCSMPHLFIEAFQMSHIIDGIDGDGKCLYKQTMPGMPGTENYLQCELSPRHWPALAKSWGSWADSSTEPEMVEHEFLDAECEWWIDGELVE